MRLLSDIGLFFEYKAILQTCPAYISSLIPKLSTKHGNYNIFTRCGGQLIPLSGPTLLEHYKINPLPPPLHSMFLFRVRGLGVGLLWST